MRFLTLTNQIAQ